MLPTDKVQNGSRVNRLQQKQAQVPSQSDPSSLDPPAAERTASKLMASGVQRIKPWLPQQRACSVARCVKVLHCIKWKQQPRGFYSSL